MFGRSVTQSIVAKVAQIQTMADSWKLESVHEQFDVFDNINERYNQINVSDLAKTIRTVTNDHLRVTERPSVPEGDLFDTIIRNTDKGQHIVISYIVIVTNEDVGNKLCKVPVFIILSTNQKKFIDLNCVVYDSWDVFMDTNSLPACEYCYPMNGEYNVGGKLIVDFGRTPAQISKKKIQFIYGLLLSGALIVGIYLSSHPLYYALIGARLLHYLPERFLGNSASLVEDIVQLLICIVGISEGGWNAFSCSHTAFFILRRIHNRHEEEICSIWNDIKQFFSACYEYITKLLDGMFENVSNSSRERFFTRVYRIQNELIDMGSDRVNQLNRGHNVTEVVPTIADVIVAQYAVFSERNVVNNYTSSINDHIRQISSNIIGLSLGCNLAHCTTAAMSSLNIYVKSSISTYCLNQAFTTAKIINKMSQTHVSDILKEDHKLNARNKKQSSTQKEASSASENDECKLHQWTEDLLLISKQLLNQFQLTALDDLQDIFETISCIVKDQYKLLMDKYCDLVSDAKECNGGKIDIDKFNGSLGINGDPKIHYWNEVLSMIQNPNQITVIKEKIKEFKKQKKMLLFPIWRASENSKTGLFKFIGSKGAGKLPARAFVEGLKEHYSINIDIDNLAIYETDSHVIIRCKEYIITIYQDVNKDNTSIGQVFVAGYSDLCDKK